MAIFGKKRGRPKGSKSGYPKKPMTLKDMFQLAMMNEFKKNPELLRRVAAKEHGYLELLEEADPIDKAKQAHILEAMENDPEFQKQVRAEYLRGGREPIEVEQEVKAAIDEIALQQIKHNPELTALLVQRRIEQLSGKNSAGGTKSTLRTALSELRDARQLEEELGLNNGKEKGGLGSFLTPEVVVTALTNLPNILQSLGGGNQTKYILDTPHGTRELTAAEYQQLQGQRQRALPPGNTVSPITEMRVPGIQPPTTVTSPVSAQPNLAQPSLNLSSWLPWLSKEPEEFISWLLTESAKDSKEGKQASYALKLITELGAEKFMSTVLPAKVKGGTVAEAISKMEASPEWLGKVAALLRMEPKNETPEDIAPIGG